MKALIGNFLTRFINGFMMRKKLRYNNFLAGCVKAYLKKKIAKRRIEQALK